MKLFNINVLFLFDLTLDFKEIMYILGYLRKRLGYLGNPRSLKEGTETYVGLTDE